MLFITAALSGTVPDELRAETLSVRVLEQGTGRPAAGVAVYLLKNRSGGVTGEDGRYVLEVPAAGVDTLRCRGLEYREKRVPVRIPGTVEVRLEQDLPVLETVEVKAARPDELPAHERTSSSVNVIAREDIPERAATLDQVLDSEAGIDIRSLGGVGARSDISIRGSSTDQVAVYVDGIPLTAGGSGFNGLSQAPVGQVGRIEVYRGSSPGMFGSGAIGGIVNVTTVPADSSIGVESSASYGSFNTAHQALAARFGSARNRFVFGVGRNSSDNDFRYFDNRGTTFDTRDDGWEHRKNSDYESKNCLGRWDASLGDHHQVSAVFSLMDSDRGVSGLGSKPALEARLASTTLLSQVRHRFRNVADTRVWFMRENLRFRDPLDEAGRRGRQDTDDEIEVRGIETNLTRVFGPVVYHANLEFRNERYDSRDAYESAVIPPSRRNQAGAGIEAEIMLRNGDLWISPRTHVTLISDRLRKSSILLAQSAVDSTITLDRTTATFALGVRYRLNPTITVRANGGWYPRLPEFGELFGDTGDVVGNTDLKEERGANFDAGLHYSPPNGVFEADASLFHRFVDDLIQRRNYGDYLIAENIGKAEVAGAETWAGLGLFDRRVTGNLSLTFQDARNRSDETLLRRQRYYGKLLPYHPQWKGSARMGVRPLRFLTATWRTDWESECFTGPSNLSAETIPARVIHTLSLRAELRGSLGILAEASNLTDDRSPDRWGYPKPGRGYYLTFTWNWEREE